MKKTAITLAIPFLLVLSSVSSAFAAQTDCESNAVHCAYISGLSTNLDDGRFIKLIANEKTIATVCLNNTGTINVLQDEAAHLPLGKNIFQYQICKDRNGTTCTPISPTNDVFNLKKYINEKFIAEPRYYNVNLENVQAQFPRCSPNNNKLLISE